MLMFLAQAMFLFATPIIYKATTHLWWTTMVNKYLVNKYCRLLAYCQVYANYMRSDDGTNIFCCPLDQSLCAIASWATLRDPFDLENSDIRLAPVTWNVLTLVYLLENSKR